MKREMTEGEEGGGRGRKEEGRCMGMALTWMRRAGRGSCVYSLWRFAPMIAFNFVFFSILFSSWKQEVMRFG